MTAGSLTVMETNGYLLTCHYDGHTLTVTPANKAAAIALRGEHHNQGPLVLTTGQIEGVDYKPANRMVNGRLTLHTASGRYKLHFRRKHRAGMADLARALGATV